VRGLQGSMPYVGADLEAWLNQEPQAEHRETVEEVRSYVLGVDHTL
jgi:hypothetical protein